MINKERINKVLEHKNSTAVSIIIPTKVIGDYEVNRIRWKNEISEVQDKLEKQGIEKTSFLKPAIDLLEDPKFWANQSSGLAGYFSEDFNEIVHLIEEPQSLNVVSDTFIATPILLSKINKQRLFLLTISQNKVRFFEAVSSGIFPVKIDDLVPADMDTALNLDIQKETLHPTSQGLTNTSHFKDKSKIRLEQYLKMIDDGLWPVLEGEKVPLVLAAVEEYHSLYRELSRYKHISSHMLMGNTDTMSPAELRLQLEPVFKDLSSKEHNLISDKLNQDFENKNVVKNEDDLLFNLEIDNIETIILPSNTEEDKANTLQLEKVLRTCYSRNIDVTIRDDFDSLAAITRSEVVVQGIS